MYLVHNLKNIKTLPLPVLYSRLKLGHAFGGMKTRKYTIS